MFIHNIFAVFRFRIRALTVGSALLFALLISGTPAQCQQLSSYLWSAANSQHVVYIGSDSHIHELYAISSGAWQQNDLTLNTCIPILRVNPIAALTATTEVIKPAIITSQLAANPYGPISGFVWTGNNSEHATYIGQDGHLHDLSYSSGNCWTNTDLTLQVPNTPLPSSTSGISDYDWPQDGSEHFIYTGQDGFVHEIYKGLDGGFGRTDFSGAPAAIGPVAGYVWPQTSSEHIVYMGIGGGLNELYLTIGTGWGLNTSFGGHAPAAVGTALTGYAWPEDDSEHVDYIVEDSLTPYELWYTNSWGDSLIENNNDDPRPFGYNSQSISGYVWPSNHSEHVLAIDFNSHLHEYYLNLSTDHAWHDNDITATAENNPPVANPSSVSGMVWDAVGIEHAFYFDCNGHVNVASSIGVFQWVNQDLTQLTGAVPAFGCPD